MAWASLAVIKIILEFKFGKISRTSKPVPSPSIISKNSISGSFFRNNLAASTTAVAVPITSISL